MNHSAPFWVRHAALVFALRTFAAAMLAFSIALLAGYAAPLLGDDFASTSPPVN